MTKLHLDFESRSILDLSVVGRDRYVRAAKILLLGWAFDDDEIRLWEPHLEPFPKEIRRAMTSDVQLIAWNSPFEVGIFEHCLGIVTEHSRWTDPSTYARSLSLPGSLEKVGAILGLPEEDQKDKEGKRLIKLFCEPLSMGGEQTLFGVTEPYFCDWKKHPEDWQRFGEYCKQDVRTERKILRLLQDFGPTETERKVWCLDQRINQTGLPVNRDFVKKALVLADRSKSELLASIKEKTQLENPNSRDQMLRWCAGQGYVHGSLEKGAVRAALAGTKITSLCREVLTIRKESAKMSYKKFEAILSRLSDDDMLRDQFMYLGAARTGRWSGSGGVQVQNLPRPIKSVEKNLEHAIELVNAGDYTGIQEFFKYVDADGKERSGSVIDVITSCVRSAFQAPDGKKLVVCDLNAIENRVLGWMAGCDAILNVFRQGRCPYMDFAAKMYNCSYDAIADTSVFPHKSRDKGAAERRQIAKPAVLGCGYGLGSGVARVCKNCGKHAWAKAYSCKTCGSRQFRYEPILKTNPKTGDLGKTGLLAYAENMGVVMTPKQAYTAHRTFRDTYPEVVQLWKDFGDAAIKTVSEGDVTQVGPVTFSRVEVCGKFVLRMLLSSWRALHYWNVQLVDKMFEGQDGDGYERQMIQYDGIGHGVGVVGEEAGGQGMGWGPVLTSGPKLVENADQAISRDIFANGMLLVEDAGGTLVLHSHDELGALSDDNDMSFGLEDLRQCMTQSPSWCPDLPLAAAGYEGKFYRKE